MAISRPLADNEAGTITETNDLIHSRLPRKASDFEVHVVVISYDSNGGGATDIRAIECENARPITDDRLNISDPGGLQQPSLVWVDDHDIPVVTEPSDEIACACACADDHSSHLSSLPRDRTSGIMAASAAFSHRSIHQHAAMTPSAISSSI